ncbi:hypothetical protein [Spirillospora sp. CA-294931]|uniref:hypothetical protein n=1 Tax=Spirillospora sp. CA-294931 TaxID=3240042 RepID=UPI003D8BB3E0
MIRVRAWTASAVLVALAVSGLTAPARADGGQTRGHEGNYDPGDWSLTGPAFMHSGGAAYELTLNLPNAVPQGGVGLTFAADNKRMYVPASRTLPEGTQGALNFRLSAPSDVLGDVTITARLDGVAKTRSHTTRVRPGLSNFEVPRPTYGGRTYEGKVRLNGVTDVPLTVALASSTPAFKLPSEVTVPAGRSSVTFKVTTAPVTDVVFVKITVTLDRDILKWDEVLEPAPH